MLSDLESFRLQISRDTGTMARRLIHNVITQNAHVIQEIYAVVPQDALSLSRGDQIDLVRKQIQQNPIQAAKAFLRINKNNFAMKCEFSAYKMLHSDSKPRLNRRLHEIHKVVMNALALFFEDFKEKNVHVEIDNCTAKVAFDYESVQVVLYHLLDNATKYVLPKTRFRVSFPIKDTILGVCLDMVSMQITDTDAGRMFDDGYSGELPKTLKLAGAGLGLGVIRDLLALNKATVEVRRNVDASRKITSLLGPYENNQFDIMLGRAIGS